MRRLWMVIALSFSFMTASIGYTQEIAEPALPPTNQSPDLKKPAGLDPGLIASGQAAFERNCTSCHDSGRSLQKQKSLGAWRRTVRRMAAMDDANVPSGDIESIAVYLASRNSNGASNDTESVLSKIEQDISESDISLFGTVSPLWRGGSPTLQNNGFFPQLFLGAAWEKGAFSVKATACTSCHGAGEDPGFLNRIDLLNASVRVDIGKLLYGECTREWQLSLEGGRLVVPFGAFASQVNPGVYRTVSMPLIYNMGQRVRDDDLGDPVLPMPYSDEGLNVAGSVALIDFGGSDVINLSYDFYVVNGLNGNEEGIDFDRSRELLDNNSNPAVGGRVTIGSRFLRLGSSVMGGRFSDNPGLQRLNYLIYGFDAVARYENLLRFQFEYAQRNTDTLPAADIFTEKVSGYYFELEGRLCNESKLSALARWDHQNRNNSPPDTVLDPTLGFATTRFTYGLNYAVSSNSLLMVNHEIWMLPQHQPHIDVFGVRYSLTF